jgi:hypothetical protein
VVYTNIPQDLLSLRTGKQSDVHVPLSMSVVVRTGTLLFSYR